MSRTTMIKPGHVDQSAGAGAAEYTDCISVEG